MITPADIAKNLHRLRGEAPSGRLYDDKGRDVNAEAPRPDNWRRTQSATPISDLLRGK